MLELSDKDLKNIIINVFKNISKKMENFTR